LFFRENIAPTVSSQFCAVVLERNSYQIMQLPRSRRKKSLSTEDAF
jgi:hypothetical protein